MEPIDNKESSALLQDSHVKEVLIADKGDNAILESWYTKPFTKKGDNFTSFITSIIVKYSLDGNTKEVSYVAKLNPCWSEMEMDDMYNSLFRKESIFYMDILRDINFELVQVEQKQLEFPQCFYASDEMKREVIIFEDLRTPGFKMTDKLKGMDVPHATLVMKALGRFHGGSILLQQKTNTNNLSEKYETLNDHLWIEKLKDAWIISVLKTGAAITESIGGYEPVREWIEKTLENIDDFLSEQWGDSPPFNVVIHGDCWTNNVLFRYNSEGLPEEVMLLDVEVNRFCSLAVDLSYFMATSLDGKTRKDYKEQLLREYYSSLISVIEGGGGSMPFTIEELKQEFERKRPFGLLWGIATLPPILMPPEDLPDFGTHTEEWKQKTVNSIGSNEALKTRLLALFDEMMEDGKLGS
ncbi:unnamed protein product [Meganyctiphanes norvegica]|uniref:CHK kinase-like domain-containing protein n=1 Tax=Meganyctiphanes norvegica TaxID=48144 RepID=A0AAV2RY45_MEGNR